MEGHNCDLSGWGRLGVQQFTNTGTRGKYADAKGEAINCDAGIKIDRSARTVVERCYVHDPRPRANSWMFSHPAGSTAIHVNSARGGTVVRWNDFIGSDEHRWNDVIEASSNSAADGGFFRDSDIGGNFLAFGNDDGVELEVGGMNVRFYRYKMSSFPVLPRPPPAPSASSCRGPERIRCWPVPASAATGHRAAVSNSRSMTLPRPRGSR